MFALLSYGPSGLPAARLVGVARGLGKPFTSLCASHPTFARQIDWKKKSVILLANLILPNMVDQVKG